MKKGCIHFLFILLIVTVVSVFAGPQLIQHMLRLYYPQSYSEIVKNNAETFSLSEDLIYAVIHAESKFDHDAKSHAGATGLMQLTDETFEWINSKYPPESESPNVLNPADNIHAGSALLSLLLNHYGDMDVALSAYNAGMGNVDKWLENPKYSTDGKTLDKIPFPETKKYVEQVKKNYKKYQELYPKT